MQSTLRLPRSLTGLGWGSRWVAHGRRLSPDRRACERAAKPTRRFGRCLAAQWLTDREVCRPRERDVERVTFAGGVPGEVRVTPHGVAVELEPAL